MTVYPLEIPDLLLIQSTIHRDPRGFFMERFHEDEFRRHNISCRFVQDNHSRSFPGVLRGLHLQQSPMQSKLVSVAHGSIWDVADGSKVDTGIVYMLKLARSAKSQSKSSRRVPSGQFGRRLVLSAGPGL